MIGEKINNTGILYAVKDKPNHISVYPIGGTIEDWAKQGIASIWTGALKSVVVKWDGLI